MEHLGTANLRTKTPDFGGFDSSRVLILKGWTSHVHRELSGNFESKNLSRDNPSRGIGRMGQKTATENPLEDAARNLLEKAAAENPQWLPGRRFLVCNLSRETGRTADGRHRTREEATPIIIMIRTITIIITIIISIMILILILTTIPMIVII